MIDIRRQPERAILVAVPPIDEPQQEVDEHLDELARLADTAGADVVGLVVQRRKSPHPALYIGKGKADQLRDAASRDDATLVVFDDNLSPAQGLALERRLGLRVMDRTELILDIFALRARTAEAKTQVELAQLQYLRPRLKRMWTHLSRTEGGIGARGPGEQQLETDRRLIDRRIARLRGGLEGIARSRRTRRKARSLGFGVALVGYTNAGKSSILQELSGRELFVEDRLFATLDSATRAVDLGDGYQALITDTVGFIRKLPHHLVASFRATLEEVEEADLLVHVIDASSPAWERQMEAVNEVIGELGARGPVLLAFHKIDQLTHDEEATLRRRVSELYDSHVLTSVRESGGLDSLRDALLARIRAERPTVRVTLSARDGRTLAEAYREGEVLERREKGASIELTARVPAALVGRWRRQEGVRVTGTDAA
ncbi:MAG: GTPase HflX [Gemmatimonadetes bacterium]|nr:GTPase HflX [Gemmatimonadota bacterium]